MTLAATQIEQVLEARFRGIRFGRYNCRKISGSTTYSQHSWPGGNARDLYAPVDHPDPMGFLDEVNTWLAWNKEALSIRLILWRVRDHYSHMHVDFWPHGHQVPPCAGGSETYQYSSGQIVAVHNPDPENGYYQPEGDEMPRLLFEEMIKALFRVDGGEFRGDPNYWIGKIDTPDDPEWQDFWLAYTRQWELML